MTQTLSNGITPATTLIGTNGLVGKGGRFTPATGKVITSEVSDLVYDDESYPKYLEGRGYTLEEVAHARPISNPYAGVDIPPYGRTVPIDLSSFRTGHRPTVDELASEIRVTFEGQIPLAEILERVIQDAYGNLNELAEVMPGYGDRQRKRKLIEYAVATRKQIIKVYAISVWARAADDVQKAVNLLSFLVRSAAKITAIKQIMGSTAGVLTPAKRRNFDLVTSLDVLFTGAYRKLPSVLEEFKDEEPVTDAQVITTLQALNDAIRYRLRLNEVVPVAMGTYTVMDGRVCFTVPERFEMTLGINGPTTKDLWYAVDLKFLIAANPEDPDALRDFPSDPPQWMKFQIITCMNDLLWLNRDPHLDPGHEEIPKQKDPAKIDTPLVRAFNMLQMMSLTYQIEILHYQAMQLMRLGWHGFTAIKMELPLRRKFTVVYWNRPNQLMPTQPNRGDFPPTHGGSITFSIITKSSTDSTSTASAGHVNEVLTLLESKVKLFDEPDKTPSDEVEVAEFQVSWEPVYNALHIPVAPEELPLELTVDPNRLDFASVLQKATKLHAYAILRRLRRELLETGPRNIFAAPFDVELFSDEAGGYALRVHLCGSQAVIVSIDERTGKIILKDLGVFAASNRSGRFLAFATYVNRHPSQLAQILKKLKLEVIVAEIEHQAKYLSLWSTRHLAIPPSESIAKFGGVTYSLYIHLGPFTDYYLAMLGSDEGLRWALVNVEDKSVENFQTRRIVDFGWLDLDQIGRSGSKERLKRWAEFFPGDDVQPRIPEGAQHLTIKTEMLRELYAFCCARVSHKKVEQQLKTRGIPWTLVFSSSGPADGPNASEQEAPLGGSGLDGSSLSPFSSTARSVPKICIRIGDILQSEGANNVAYENVKIKVVDWWSERPSRVITSVRLRDIQPTSQIGTLAARQALDPSRNITYDPATSIVSFISYDINTCVDEFLGEWERVQRVACIVREVGQVKEKRRWEDIKIRSFNLQCVDFIYHSKYAVAIQWVHPSASDLGARGLYEMDFKLVDGGPEDGNPHQDIAPFLSMKLQTDAIQSVTFAVERLILVLRESLSLLLAIQEVKRLNPGRFTLFAKSESWYRLMLGHQHALDFRILGGDQVVLADVTSSLFAPHKTVEVTTTPHTSLIPIPAFQEVAHSIAQATTATSRAFPPVAFVEGGIVCAISIVHTVVPQLCEALKNRIWS